MTRADPRKPSRVPAPHSPVMLELLVLAIAPALFILLYMYRRDSYEPEPLHLVAWIFFLGALSVIPAGLLELLFPEGVFSSAFVAPVIEETLKFLVVFLAIYRHPEFDEPVDGMVYATAAGLGFATIENILYVLEGGLAVGIIRAVASVPGHVVFSCIWGFSLGTAKFRPGNERTGIILAGLFGAMLMHGIFNFSLQVLTVAGLLLILLVIIPLGWWMTSRNIRCAHADPSSACSAQGRAEASGSAVIIRKMDPDIAVSAKSAEMVAPGQRFCTDCGATLHEGMRFCENCGKKAEGDSPEQRSP
ncbi:MAG TPA: PrsW family glutamic-type intramembrane protease [Methanoregula sp.]|nr:PrsW family glutamic-type intramembrane protease [Methanoregula sp.]